MNQILVTEKLYITPEFKRKRRLYKIEFFLSVFLVCILFSYYVYAEYDRNKNEKVSQEILEQIATTSSIDPTIKKPEDDIIRIIIDDQEEITQEQEERIQEVKENSIVYSDDDSLIWHHEKWTATDIETGCKLTTGRTLEECKSNVMQIMNKIIDRRNSNAGQMYREQFKQILNGELGNGVIKLENEYI